MRHAVRTLTLIAILASSFIFTGCAFVNVNIPTGHGPLEERTIEGEGKQKILLIDISGVISDKERRRGLAGKQPSLPARIREELKKAKDDPLVAGVVLRIDSPGGTVAASDTIHHEVQDFRRRSKKPVYASITGLGTSGGYYVACAADKIHVHPAAITGSIGVIAMQLNIEGLMEKLGIQDKTYTTGKNKALFTPVRADTPEEKEIIQALLNSFHERFVDIVFSARKNKLSRSAVASLADGRPYTAKQALDNGLIDAVAYMDETIATMKLDLGLKEARVIRYVRPGGHGGSIYSIKDSSVNMVSVDGGFHIDMQGPEFMYIWPGF